MIALTPAPSPDTTAWRIGHDVPSGIWIDSFDGHWLVQTKGAALPESVVELARSTAKSLYWKRRDAAATTTPERVWGEEVAGRFEVMENGARFLVDFGAGYSPGIFLDQRLNRRETGQRARRAETVLNAFAYTGAFSVMAALSGAVTTTLDLSKPYLNWGWENFALNGLDREDHHGCRGDAFEWMATFARQGRDFGGIVLDPPTFSRHRGRTFRTDRDYADLVALAAKITSRGGWMLCCANTHRLRLGEYRKQVLAGIREAGRRVLNVEEWPMPPEFHGDDYLKTLWVDVG